MSKSEGPKQPVAPYLRRNKLPEPLIFRPRGRPPPPVEALDTSSRRAARKRKTPAVTDFLRRPPAPPGAGRAGAAPRMPSMQHAARVTCEPAPAPGARTNQTERAHDDRRTFAGLALQPAPAWCPPARRSRPPADDPRRSTTSDASGSDAGAGRLANADVQSLGERRPLHRLRAAQLRLRDAARGRARPAAHRRRTASELAPTSLHAARGRRGSYPASALVNRTHDARHAQRRSASSSTASTA